jgi:hypothetical protein
VVACASGTSNFCIAASDSPHSVRSFDAASPSASSTFSLGCRRHLLLGPRVSTLTIALAAQTGNRPGNVGLQAAFFETLEASLVSKGVIHFCQKDGQSSANVID